MSLGHTAQPSTCCARHPVEGVEHERGGSQSASQCRLVIVPDLVAVPGIAKAAEGKYQVIDEEISGMGPRRVGYFNFWKF
jgi:hypothetical protein